jgi:arylsulfatase A-like enzyme
VLEALEEQGLTDDTIIVFAGDNGLAVGQHGLFGKQNCYEHSVRVPMVFAGPGVPKQQRTDAYAYLFDVFPTLCELTGIEVPESVEGVSLVDAIQDPEETVRESLFFAYTGKQRAVKDERFKLIEYVVDGRHTETQLFDLQNDPWELNNLAGNASYVENLEDLRDMLAEYRDEWDDEETKWGQTFWEGYAQ